MNLEKVIFGFFIVLALTLNFGFFVGDFDNPAHHNVFELFAVIVVNLIATVLKFGDRTQIGAVTSCHQPGGRSATNQRCCGMGLRSPYWRHGTEPGDHGQHRIPRRWCTARQHHLGGAPDH